MRPIQEGLYVEDRKDSSVCSGGNGARSGHRAEVRRTSRAQTESGHRHCAGSDGIYQGQHPHPRGYAAFARLAQHYLAGAPDTGYQQLARHLSANAADAYGLRKRGRLASGMATGRETSLGACSRWPTAMPMSRRHTSATGVPPP